MWTDTEDGKEYIKDISRLIVSEVDSDELPLFNELITEYFEDPRPPDLSSSSSDDPLAFGLEAALIPTTHVAAALASAVITYLLNEVISAVKEESSEVIKKEIKELFSGKKDEKGKQKAARVTFTNEQLDYVKNLAFAQAKEFGMGNKKAGKMANSLVGVLVIGK